MKPFDLLPHRYPFVMVDAAETAERGRHALGRKRISLDDPSVMPDGRLSRVFLVEALAQLSGIAVGNRGPSTLAGLKDIKFFGDASAGDTLELESVLERSFSGMCIFSCSASVSGRVVAEGGIILYFYGTEQNRDFGNQ
jgi:3-hydroxyacyl-[acyl-carrier-protein] dehydratase